MKFKMIIIIRDGICYFLEYIYYINGKQWTDLKNLSGLMGEPITNVSKGHLNYHSPLTIDIIKGDF